MQGENGLLHGNVPVARVTAWLRQLRGCRRAAYLCSVSPGASLEISETETQALDKETGCAAGARLPAPGVPVALGAAARDKAGPAPACSPVPPRPRLRADGNAIGGHFVLPENEMNTKAQADKHDVLTFMFNFQI